MTILIKNGRLVDPASDRDERVDILIKGDSIEKIGKKLSGGMHQFLSGEITPVLGTAANTTPQILESRGFWRLRRKPRTARVPELGRT